MLLLSLGPYLPGGWEIVKCAKCAKLCVCVCTVGVKTHVVSEIEDGLTLGGLRWSGLVK